MGLEGGKLELNDGSLGRKSHLVVGKMIFPILYVSKNKNFACLDLLPSYMAYRDCNRPF